MFRAARFVYVQYEEVNRVSCHMWHGLVLECVRAPTRLEHVNRFKSLIILRYFIRLYRCHNAILHITASNAHSMCAPLAYYQVWSFQQSCQCVAAQDTCFFLSISFPHRPGQRRWRQLFIIDLCALRLKSGRQSKGFGVSIITRICICVNVVINSKSIDAVWWRRAVHIVRVALLEFGLLFLRPSIIFILLPERC